MSKRTIKFPLPRVKTFSHVWDQIMDFDSIKSDFVLRRVCVSSLIGAQPSVTVQGLQTVDWRRPIYVVQIGNMRYVRDGHHRVTRAVLRGQKTIMAYVVTL